MDFYTSYSRGVGYKWKKRVTRRQRHYTIRIIKSRMTRRERKEKNRALKQVYALHYAILRITLCRKRNVATILRKLDCEIYI